MIREVLETDPEGGATVILWRLTDEERREQADMLREQEERGREVAKSLGVRNGSDAAVKCRFWRHSYDQLSACRRCGKTRVLG